MYLTWFSETYNCGRTPLVTKNKYSRAKGSKFFLQQGGCVINNTHECQHSHNSNMASENPHPPATFNDFLLSCKQEGCKFDNWVLSFLFKSVLNEIEATDWEKLVHVCTDFDKTSKICDDLSARKIDGATIFAFIEKMEDDRPVGLEASYFTEMETFAKKLQSVNEAVIIFQH